MTQTAEPAPQTGLLYIVILSYPFRLFNHYCRVFLDLRQLQSGKAVRHLGEQWRRYPVARLPVFHKNYNGKLRILSRVKPAEPRMDNFLLVFIVYTRLGGSGLATCPARLR